MCYDGLGQGKAFEVQRLGGGEGERQDLALGGCKEYDRICRVGERVEDEVLNCAALASYGVQLGMRRVPYHDVAFGTA